jgi:hypothetical protein
MVTLGGVPPLTTVSGDDSVKAPEPASVKLKVMAWDPKSLFTVKLTVKLAEMPLSPLSVTLAVYIPTASPVTGTTVKVSFPPAAMLLIDAALKVKEPGLVPESAIVKAPVAWFPVLLTVMVWAVGASYPSVAAGNVTVPDGFKPMP